jgi:hypothetical protein
MSEFKDMIQEDIKNVFLDLEMFGETHIVAGKERTIILDDGEKLRRSELYQDSKGIYNKQIFFYIAAEDLARKPEIGQVMDVDGRDYKLLHIDHEDGMYAVTAEEFRGK